MTIKNILFDFDGVILDSMPVRDLGFREVLNHFNKIDVDKLIEYHNINGGLSRFVKIKHFFNNILLEEITELDLQRYCSDFSKIMKKLLVNEKLLICDTVDFIRENHKQYSLHIVSGSEQNELRFLCKELGLDQYFITINGSPIAKKTLVKQVIDNYKYQSKQTILIGDSINDYEAAINNNITFYGYNNKELQSLADSRYINSFESLIL